LQIQEERYTCANSKCKQVFDNPKLVHYYVCPFCFTFVEGVTIDGCLNYFGYLNERETGKVIPIECTACREVIDCLLGNEYSKDVIEEIKKWYK